MKKKTALTSSQARGRRIELRRLSVEDPQVRAAECRAQAADQESVHDHRRRPQVCSSSSSPGADTSSSLPFLLPPFDFFLLPEDEELGLLQFRIFEACKTTSFRRCRNENDVV